MSMNVVVKRQCWPKSFWQRILWFRIRWNKDAGIAIYNPCSFTSSSKYGHFWPPKNKMATAVMLNLRLQKGSSQISGWRHGGSAISRIQNFCFGLIFFFSHHNHMLWLGFHTKPILLVFGKHHGVTWMEMVRFPVKIASFVTKNSW